MGNLQNLEINRAVCCERNEARVKELESELAALRKPGPATDDKIYEAFFGDSAIGGSLRIIAKALGAGEKE